MPIVTSMDGVIAMLFAAHRPERLRALVINEDGPGRCRATGRARRPGAAGAAAGLATLACPTLVVRGRDSDGLSAAQAGRMAEALPHGDLLTVPEIGRAPTLVEPAALNAIERLIAQSQ